MRWTLDGTAAKSRQNALKQFAPLSSKCQFVPTLLTFVVRDLRPWPWPVLWTRNCNVEC